MVEDVGMDQGGGGRGKEGEKPGENSMQRNAPEEDKRTSERERERKEMKDTFPDII